MSGERFSAVVAVTNSNASSVLLVVEPWGDQQSIAPGSSAELNVTGPQGGRLEIEVKSTEVIVYGWEGSVISIVTPS